MQLTASRTAALAARHAVSAAALISDLLGVTQNADAEEVVTVGAIRPTLAFLESDVGECLYHLGGLLEHDRLSTLGAADTSPRSVTVELSEDEVALLLVVLEAGWLRGQGEADALSRDARKLRLRRRAAANAA